VSWEVRPYAGPEFAAVVRLLARALAGDAMTEGLFARKVLLDPSFDPQGAPVAWMDGRPVGFLLAIARVRPLEDGPDDRDRGWITLFGVEAAARNRGIGSALLERGTSFLAARGCKRALVSPYAPNYWVPGVDPAAYPEAVAFLERRGFATVARPISMDVRLWGGWRIPDWVQERQARLAQEGVRLEAFSPALIPALTAFLREEFPGDWQRYLREAMLEVVAGRRPPESLLVAWDGDRMIGFSQHEGERFGPFGVAASQRGRGVGALLLFHTLEQMRRAGCHNAWFLWTDDRNADRIYKSAGFVESRRYAVMARDL